MKKFIRNKDTQIQQFPQQNTSEKKKNTSPLKSQVVRKNQWVDPSSSSSSDYSDESDTEANYE